jgi:hypothetical protein
MLQGEVGKGVRKSEKSWEIPQPAPPENDFLKIVLQPASLA